MAEPAEAGGVPVEGDPLDGALPADPAEQAGAMIEQAVADDNATLTRDESPADPADCDLVKTWWARTAETQDFSAAVKQMEADLEAILGNAADLADAEKVTVRHIYRNALQTTAMCVPADHRASWKQREEVDLVPGDSMIPGLHQQLQAEKIKHAGLAAVMRLLVMRFCEEANFQETLEAWAQDAAHFPACTLKFYYQRDLEGDPVSEERLPDEQDNIARIRVLTERYARGEFTKSDAEWRQLTDLMQIMGKTEIARREGIVAEIIPLPQYRVDPAVDGPENIGRARWHRHDVLMLRDEVLAKWSDIDPEELETQAHAYSADAIGRAVKRERIDKTKTSNQAAMTDVNRAGLLGTEAGSDWYLVAEIYDLETNHRLVLIEGLDYPVVNEPITNMPTGLVPFEVLVLNRVPRRLYGMSDTQLQAKIQDRINWKRSEEEGDRDAAKPRWGYDPATLGDGKAVIRASEADPYTAVPIPVAGKGTLKDSLVPLMGNHEFNPQEYDTTKDEQEMRRMAALPEQALGVTGGARFSREVQAAQDGMNIMAKYRQARMSRALKRVYSKIAQLLIFNVGPDLAIRMAGPLAARYWPAQPMDRQKIYDGLDITVDVAMDATLEDAKQITDLTDLVKAGASAGAVVDSDVFTKIFSRLTSRIADVDGLFKPDPNALAMRLAEALQKNPGVLTPDLAMAVTQAVMQSQPQVLPGAPPAPGGTAPSGAPMQQPPPMTPPAPMVGAPA